MKLSVSLPDADVSFVDSLARRGDGTSRSSIVHQAIELLRMAELENAYADAWEEWRQDGDADAWQSTVGDGMTDAPR